MVRVVKLMVRFCKKKILDITLSVLEWECRNLYAETLFGLGDTKNAAITSIYVAIQVMISMQTFICCTLRNPSTKIYSQRFSKAFFFLRDYFLLVAVTAFLFTNKL